MIYSAVPSGSGSLTVHRQLAERLPDYRLQSFAPYLEFAPFLLTRYIDRRAALVHAPPDHAVFVTGRRQKLVVTFHNYVIDAFMKPYSTVAQRLHYATDLRWFIAKAVSRAAMLTAVSHHTAQLAKQDLNYQGEIKVIPNGVDIQRFTPAEAVDKRKLIALFSGNLTRRKGAHLLPRIAQRLGANVELHYTLGSRNRRALPDAPKLRAIGAIRYADMPALYQRADLLVMPTVREGLSMAVLEAMAAGLPVVGSDCSSMPELVVDGEGGFLCRPNQPADFAEAINKLADSSKMRHEMGEFNRSRVEQFYNLARMIGDYRQLFTTILDKG